ncbi:bifunctional riboflavin kinase/FAD synthetase [Gloeobacter violaceus]|uniref:Riboflavin biosynthesis protein n=1 Tax=Gloeobacter violaceus (strain ATCC 29082 / PCC 7421) TaxID=251221 RepID=Q7NP41_GLOVI|nr:bifunctional riboflavin kinase/FAD synthetase [Gloeobacter violaceus]BAC88158.1 riboflavin biosynthesis protein [Gloeobacter violaceus PCC 7421]
MAVFRSLSEVATPCAVALGNFDGVHLGHQAVIQAVLGRAGIPTVLTFDPHPREYFTGKTGFLLAPERERTAAILALGIAQVLVLPFDELLAATEAGAFVEQVLVAGLGARFVSVGWNFRFGKERAGTTEMLQSYARAGAFDIEILAERQVRGRRVSSSVIREALGCGDLDLARLLLGRAYGLEGEVVRGDQRGRLLGFPTANLQVSGRKFLPKDGVYLVSARWGVQQRWGLLNLGLRPTFDGLKRTIEVHVLDWEGDLYGQHIKITLERYLRPEQKFGSPGELVAQLHRDREAALKEIAGNP